MNKTKWFIARMLDKFFPRRYCWYDLVMWTYEYREWEDVKRDLPRPECKKDGSYCGKCVELGLLKPRKADGSLSTTPG